jgi:hypothetical protein
MSEAVRNTNSFSSSSSYKEDKHGLVHGHRRRRLPLVQPGHWSNASTCHPPAADAGCGIILTATRVLSGSHQVRIKSNLLVGVMWLGAITSFNSSLLQAYILVVAVLLLLY